MKIVVVCPQYWPSIGGLPIVTRLLCRELVRSGHDVILLTLAPTRHEMGRATNEDSFRVIRNPSLFKQFRIYLQCDGAIIMHPTLRLGLLARLLARRSLLAHHTFQVRGEGLVKIIRYFLVKLLRAGAREVACSRWLAKKLGPEVGFVPNPYDDNIFFPPASDRIRDIDVLFVGNLTVDKGIFRLCDAIGSSTLMHVVRRFVIVAPPFDEDQLHQHILRRGIDRITQYKGALAPKAVADLMRRSRVVAVPSAWNEPFGLVALEAVACGAIVVASRDGGLPEAAGPDSLIVEPGDVNALTAAIGKGLLLSAEQCSREQKRSVPQFLTQHAPSAAAFRYIEFLFGEKDVRRC